MIVPFWSWNLSDTTHVRPHIKFQLVWAINTVFTRGGAQCAPPSLKCVAGTPSLLGLKLYTKVWSNAKCSETVSKLCGTWKNSFCSGSGNVTIDDRYQTHFKCLVSAFHKILIQCLLLCVSGMKSVHLGMGKEHAKEILGDLYFCSKIKGKILSWKHV